LENNLKLGAKDSIVRSTFWIYARILITSILNIAVISILARELDPADFGLVALAGVFIQFFTFVSSQGVNEYIIYITKDKTFDQRVQSAFWLDITISLSIIILLTLSLPVILSIYTMEGLGLIIMALAIKFPIDALARTPDALLKKELQFKEIELRDTIIQIAGALISVAMAFSGFGVWSLVIPAIIISPAKAIVAFRVSNWKPQLKLYLHHWKEIFQYTRNVMGATLTSFIISQGDTLLVGKVLNESLLGIYNMAWRSSNLVSKSILQVSNKLTLPLLARAKGNKEEILNRLIRILRLIGLICFPPLVALMVVADVFVLSLYGDKWMAAVLPLRILLIYALRFTISSPIGATFKAIGRPEMNFRIGLIIVPFYLAGIYWGSFYGIVGVATGVTVVRTASGFLNFFLLSRALETSYLTFTKCILAPAGFSLLYGVSVFAVRLVLTNVGLEQPVALLLSSIFFSFPFGLLILRLGFPVLGKELMGIINRFLPAKYALKVQRLLLR
jgi:PST family polysaccharide transporter